MVDLSIPTAEEVFDKPYLPSPPVPSAWDAESSIAAYLADHECARLLVNCLFDPPITDHEIAEFSRRFKVSESEAELEIRRARNA